MSTPDSIDRRRALKLIGAAGALPLAFDWTAEEVGHVLVELEKRAATPAAAQVPEFFTAHEWDTVRILVDLVIPADDRSGSATDAGVPEFMDFMMVDGSDGRRRTMREGLAWLDAESGRRFGGLTFVGASDAQRRQILDAVAWPDRAPESVAEGVGWFNSFRDLTAAGFFSSRVGYEDLRYMGNTAVEVWNGCPEPAMTKLGVSPGVMGVRR